ncbi:MAG TPA: ATP-binding protein, partial [Negativicutes bacterium]|nr:ATP-binding protein [Negativicutes bacterium]
LLNYNINNGSLISVEDVTAEELEKDVAFEKRKNEALNHMIASIAHEIKNPLTTISAAAAMIVTNGESKSFWEAFSKYVPNEIDRINRLIQNLVYYARPSQTQSEPVNVKNLILAFRHLIMPMTQKSDISAEFQAEHDLYVLANKDKLNQVLFNLILNSIESVEYRKTQEDSEYEPLVRLWAVQTDSSVVIAVQDNGTGMTTEETENCTKPFFTTKNAGAGLGLSVSLQYIHEIGGELYVESELGEYSRFTIILPQTITSMI